MGESAPSWREARSSHMGLSGKSVPIKACGGDLALVGPSRRSTLLHGVPAIPGWNMCQGPTHLGWTLSLWSSANPFLEHMFQGESSPFHCWLPCSMRERRNFTLGLKKPCPTCEAIWASGLPFCKLPDYLALENKWILVKPLGAEGTETDSN